MRLPGPPRRSSEPRLTSPPRAGPKFPEFVALVALMIGMAAYSVDNLLPAFDPIRATFRLADPNDAQLVIYAYMISFALAQAVHGTVSDIVGRRPVLMAGLAIFAAGSLLAIAAPSFEFLLAARVIQGFGTAAARVLATAIVRDLYVGRDMARVMSLVMMVFLTVPVVAPAVGSALLLIGGWQVIFASMLLLALLLAVWFGIRMPETLRPEHRMPFSAARIAGALRLTVTTRESFGYATAIGLLFGPLMAYIGSAQQILETTVYGLGPVFTLYFAIIAGVQAVASLVNARLVGRFGMRRLSHIALCGYVAVCAVHLALAIHFGGKPPLALFMTLLAVTFFLFSFTIANFNAMAMQPLGAVAGTASSFIGAYTTLLGSIGGLLTARAFDGTVVPILTGFCVLGGSGLAIVVWTERGRLFGAHQE
jgi:MFS transporter, DHA1 family, multidrug resistance protein